MFITVITAAVVFINESIMEALSAGSTGLNFLVALASNVSGSGCLWFLKGEGHFPLAGYFGWDVGSAVQAAGCQILGRLLFPRCLYSDPFLPLDGRKLHSLWQSSQV
jgi:hypothetical protein